MNFLDWLEKMRSKPVKSRRLVAFGVSLFLTGFLFVVWISFLLPNFFQNQNITEKNQTLETPKDSVFQNIQTAWNTFGSQVSVLKSTIGTTVGLSFGSTIKNTNLSSAIEYKATSSISGATTGQASSTRSTTDKNGVTVTTY